MRIGDCVSLEVEFGLSRRLVVRVGVRLKLTQAYHRATAFFKRPGLKE